MKSVELFCCSVLLLLYAVAAAGAQSLTVTTLAGPSESQGGSADGTGDAARFERPVALSIDRSGNLYVTEKYRQSIRKVAPDGTVTTLAGLGTSPGSDDGARADARFQYPTGTAVDADGNVYVADTDNSTIRKVTPQGIVTTVAGSPHLTGDADGQASDARFYWPRGITADPQGNVYIADSGNHTIRKMTRDGVVSTLAGRSGDCGFAAGYGNAARFCEPAGLAIDARGDIYVADKGNGAVRKITPAGLVTTIASRWSLESPTAVAVDADGNVYVVEMEGHAVTKITPGGVLIPLSGMEGTPGASNGIASAARFAYPQGIACDTSGNVYVADTENHSIRKITREGSVTTLAGILRAGGSADGAREAARFDAPIGIAVDNDGNAYVADSNNHTIRRVTAAGVVTTFAGSSGAAGSADGITNSARFRSPAGVAVDVNGNLYVADTGNQTIRTISSSGTVSTIAGLTGSRGRSDGVGSAARFDSPTGIAVDREGNVYVGDVGNLSIRRISPSGGVTTVAGGSPGGEDGTGAGARFLEPTGLAVDVSGNIWVADHGSFAVRQMTPAGVVTTIQKEDWFKPYAVAAGPDGAIYVADRGTCTVRKIAADRSMSTIAGRWRECGSRDGLATIATFGGPAGIALANDGRLLVSDTNGVIREIARTLSDVATIDRVSAPVGATRLLEASPKEATSWEWSIIRQPTGSHATLSARSGPAITFTPDVADVFEFRLIARGPAGTSVSTLSFEATKNETRRRSVRH